MAAPFTSTPKIGVDLNTITTAADITAGNTRAMAKLGDEVWGSDGKRYVYVKSGGTLSASTGSCTVNTTTFVITATGGSYTTPPKDMVINDYGWASIASV